MDFDSPTSAQKAVTALKAGGVQAQMAKVRTTQPRRQDLADPSLTRGGPQTSSDAISLKFQISCISLLRARRDVDVFCGGIREQCFYVSSILEKKKKKAQTFEFRHANTYTCIDSASKP